MGWATGAGLWARRCPNRPRRVQVHPTSITNTIDRLESDGLVKRRAHPTDGRTTLAELTGEGRIVAEAAQKKLAQIEFGFDGVSTATLNRINEAISELRHKAGDF